MASSPSSSPAANTIPNTLRVSGNRRKTFGGTQPERNISVLHGGQPELPPAWTTSFSSAVSSSSSPGRSTRTNTPQSPTSRTTAKTTTNTTKLPTIGPRGRLVSGPTSLSTNSAVKNSGLSVFPTSSSTPVSTSSTAVLPSTSSIPIARTRRGSSVSANSNSTTYTNPNSSNTHKSSTTKSPWAARKPVPSSSSSTTTTTTKIPSGVSSPTSTPTSRIARVRTTSTPSTPKTTPSHTSASSAKSFSRPHTMSITDTSSAPSSTSTPPRRVNVKPNSSVSSSTSPHTLPFPSSSATASSSALRSPKPLSSSSPSPSTPSSSATRLRTPSTVTIPRIERSNSKKTLHAQETSSANRLSVMSHSSAVSSAGSVYSQSSASRSGNGKQKALEDPSVSTGDESDVEQRGNIKAKTLGDAGGSLRLDPAELEALKGVWNESPVEDPAFDPGGTPTDRHAVKSGYGSVFGFGLVSGNSSRKGSVSGNEGSVVRSSSISSISNSSATSHSTTGTAPAPTLPISADSVPVPVPSQPTNIAFPTSSSSPPTTYLGISGSSQARASTTATAVPTPTLTVNASKVNNSYNSLTARRRLSPASPTGPRAPKSPSPPRGSGNRSTSASPTAAVASTTSSASNKSKSASTLSPVSSHATQSNLSPKSPDRSSLTRTLRPSASGSSLRTTMAPSGPRPASTVRSRTVGGVSAGTGIRASIAGSADPSSKPTPTPSSSTTSSHVQPFPTSGTSVSTSESTSPSVAEVPSATRSHSIQSPVSSTSNVAPGVMSPSGLTQATQVPDHMKESPVMSSARTLSAVTPSSAFRSGTTSSPTDGLPSTSPSTSYPSSSAAATSYLNGSIPNMNSSPHSHRSASAPTPSSAPRVNIPISLQPQLASASASASQSPASHLPHNTSNHHPQTVSLKQLLSKPAPPGYTSGGGSASESEGGFISRASKKSRTIDEAEISLRKRREMEAEAGISAYSTEGEGKSDRGRDRDQDKSKTMRERSVSRSRSTGVTDSEGSKERGGLRGLTRSASWSRLRGESGEKGEKKQRNVFKRRPSTGDINNLNPNNRFVVRKNSEEFPYSSFAPSFTGQILSVPGQPTSSSAAGSRSPSRARASPIPPSAQRTKNGTDRLESMYSPPRAVTPSGTTPAEEIMLAYKQQQERERAREREREERAREREREREIWRREDEERAEKERWAREREKEKGAREKTADTSIAPAVATSSSTVASKEKTIHPTINSGDHGKEEKKNHDHLPGSSSTTLSQEDTRNFPTRSQNPIPEIDRLKVNSHHPQSSPSPSSKLLSKAITRKPSSPSEESPSGPYYTVFGDTSGRVIAVGSVEDSYSDVPSFSWSTSVAEGLSSKLGVGLGLTNDGVKDNSASENGVEVWERSSSVTVGHVKPKGFGIGLGKTLSRKMSGRLKGGMVAKKEEIHVTSALSTPAVDSEERVGPSLQERRRVLRKGTSLSERVGVGQDNNRSLRLSIDKYTETSLNAAPLTPQTPHAIKHDASFGSFDLTPLQESFTIPGPSLESTSNSPLGGPSGGKKKLWNIMKRISAGGLRDKYHGHSLDSAGSGSDSASPASPPPPVPTVPKDLSVFTKAQKAKESRGSSEPQQQKQSFSQNRTSTATVAPNSGSPSRPSVSSGSTNRPTITIPRLPPPLPVDAALTTRPSTTTRSSSPVSSSDIASSKFFRRSQSQKSSSSSFGEEIPPLPNASSSSQSLHASAKAQNLQQYIIPPSELYKLELNLEKKQSNSRPRRPSLTTTTSKSHSSVSLTSSRQSPSRSKQSKSRPSSPTEGWMIVPTPKDEKPAFSLPVPNRRRKDVPDGRLQDPDDGCSPLSDDGRPPSPIIPTFSNAAAINTWGTGPSKSGKGKSKPSPASSNDDAAPFASSDRSSYKSPAGVSEVSSSPPPLPARNPRRHTSSFLPTSSSSRAISPQHKSTSVSVSPPATAPVSGNIKAAAEHQLHDSRSNRKSIFGYSVPSLAQVSPQTRNASDSAVSPKTPRDMLQSPNTPGNRSASSSSPASASVSHKDYLSRVSQISPLRAPRTPLSEKEKADKWDDLLERSARAGGTLHLTVGTTEELASDRLRFSISAESEQDVD